MKTIKFSIIQSSIILLILFTVSACDMDNFLDNDNDYRPITDVDRIVNDADFTTSVFDEVSKEALEVAGFSIPYLKSTAHTCRNITYSPSDSVYPRTISIDYGSGCTNRRGTTLAGKLSISLSAAPTDSLAVITITLDSLRVNGYRVEGTKTLNYLGSINGRPTWTSTIQGGKITGQSGNYITYDVRNWTRTQIGGAGSASFWDNVYSVSGVTTETAYRDSSITSYSDSISVDNPVIRAAICRYPQGGVLNITIVKNDSTLRNTKVDYGVYNPDATSCTHRATVTRNGQVVSGFVFN